MFLVGYIFAVKGLFGFVARLGGVMEYSQCAGISTGGMRVLFSLPSFVRVGGRGGERARGGW